LLRTKEINGDRISGIANRLNYLVLNLARNIRPARRLKPRRFSTSNLFKSVKSVDTWSPGRGLAENFVTSIFPEIIRRKSESDPKNLSILDIGCGSGRSVDLFLKSGFSGHWEGIDIDNRFIQRESDSFKISFSQKDVLVSSYEPKFDLIYTNSALEHIPAAKHFPGELCKWLKSGGVQLHIVPAPAALPLYLWHGWRQYSLHRLEKEFEGSSLEVYPLGGLFSSFLHFIFITFWENILKISLRRRFPNAYRWLLYRSVKADRFAPILPVFYAVVAFSDTKNQSSNCRVSQ
jgi:SAM-dependent methyltransferase